jgi:hypothetical protein
VRKSLSLRTRRGGDRERIRKERKRERERGREKKKEREMLSEDLLNIEFEMKTK